MVLLRDIGLLGQKEGLDTEHPPMDECGNSAVDYRDCVQQLLLLEDPAQSATTDSQQKRCLLKKYEEQVSSLKLDILEVLHSVLLIEDHTSWSSRHKIWHFKGDI